MLDIFGAACCIIGAALALAQGNVIEFIYATVAAFCFLRCAKLRGVLE